MSKKLILLLATCLLTTSCLFGCGDDTKPSDDNPTTTAKVESTTKEDVATTEPTTAEPTTPPETTTQEPTTEEPNTEYVYKGEHFAVKASLKEYFMNRTVQKGDKISLNDLIGKDDGDEYDRGKLGEKIVAVLYFENHIEKYEEFVYTYEVVGTGEYSVPYEKNVVIEYNEEEKVYFHFVQDRGKYVDFDVYVID